MKKRYLAAGLLAGVLALGLTACNEAEKPTPSITESEVKLDKIELSNQVTLFRVGDAFTSKGLKVNARYTDNSTKDVSTEAKVSHNGDMSKAGEYTATVTYDGKSATYSFKVCDPNGLNLKTEGVKLEYVRGEELNTAKLAVELKYESGLEGKKISTADCDIQVKFGDKLDSSLFYAGEHTVNVSYKTFIASYKINVKAEAIAADAKLDDLVALASKYDLIATGGTYSNSPEKEYKYAKDANNLIVSYDEVINDAETFVDTDVTSTEYFTKDGEKILGYKIAKAKEGGKVVQFSGAQAESLAGPSNVDIIGYMDPVFGPADALAKFLEVYNSETTVNKSLVKNGTANATGKHESYTVKCEAVLVDDYGAEAKIYTVNFVLDDQYFLEKATFNIDIYAGLTADENGAYTHGEEPDYQIEVNYTQDMGERDLKLPYAKEDLIATSFVLKNGEETIENKGAITIGVNETLYLTVDSLQPTTANLGIDRPSFAPVIEDPETDPTTLQYCDPQYSDFDGSISIYGVEAGSEKVIIKTANVTYELTVNVEAAAPTSITPKYFGDAGGYDDFIEADEIYLPLNTNVDLLAGMDWGVDSRYTAEFTEETATATLTQGTYSDWSGELVIYTFNATAVGDYVVTFVSTKDPTVTAQITIHAGQEAPVINPLPADILGSWTSDSFSVDLTETKAIINLEELELTASEEGVYTFGTYVITVNADNTLTLTVDDVDTVLTRLVGAPTEYLGTWKNLNDETDVIVLTQDTITYHGVEYAYEYEDSTIYFSDDLGNVAIECAMNAETEALELWIGWDVTYVR